MRWFQTKLLRGLVVRAHDEDRDLSPFRRFLSAGSGADRLSEDVNKAMPARPHRTVRFRAFYDDDAQVWIATGEDRITAEADTRDALMDRLSTIVPDVLSSRELGAGPLTIVVDWQELRTVDQTTLAVA